MTLSLKPQRQINLQAIADQAERAAAVLAQSSSAMRVTGARKSPPVFNLSQLAAMCGLGKGSVSHRLSRQDLPAGRLNTTGSRRVFSLDDAQAWVRAYRQANLRPPGAEAVTISIANFKAGVSKTTTAMTLAQGLSLLGHRVLMIDTDPQGSLTSLFGIQPETEVDAQNTILPLAMGAETSIRSAIRPTYWTGIDLVAAAPMLSGAEFATPTGPALGFEPWRMLDLGMDDVRAEYDVVIIDTAPALTSMTINAFMASDGILMPLPPTALDFAAASQFWGVLSDLTTALLTQCGLRKEFDFIHILLARVDAADAATNTIRQWIGQCYAEKVVPVEIPETAATRAAHAAFGTVYDLASHGGSARTSRRARDACDRFVGHIEGSICAVWARQLGALSGSTPLALPRMSRPGPVGLKNADRSS